MMTNGVWDWVMSSAAALDGSSTTAGGGHVCESADFVESWLRRIAAFAEPPLITAGSCPAVSGALSWCKLRLSRS